MSGSTAYDALINQAAQQYGVPPALLQWQIGQESSFNPMAQNGNAAGLAQLMPGTAQALGVTNPYDPTQAIPAAAAYDSQLFQQTGSWTGALQRYGTLGPGVPGSVWNSYNSMMQANGIGNSTGGYQNSLAALQNTNIGAGPATSSTSWLGNIMNFFGNPQNTPTSPGGISGGGAGGAGPQIGAGIQSQGGPFGSLMQSVTGSNAKSVGNWWAELVDRILLAFLGLALVMGALYLLGAERSEARVSAGALKWAQSHD